MKDDVPTTLKKLPVVYECVPPFWNKTLLVPPKIDIILFVDWNKAKSLLPELPVSDNPQIASL